VLNFSILLATIRLILNFSCLYPLYSFASYIGPASFQRGIEWSDIRIRIERGIYSAVFVDIIQAIRCDMAVDKLRA